MKYKAFESFYCSVAKAYIEKGQVFEVDESKANNYRIYAEPLIEPKVEIKNEPVVQTEPKVEIKTELAKKKR